jgi:hypothetical protein
MAPGAMSFTSISGGIAFAAQNIYCNAYWFEVSGIAASAIPA